MTGREWEDALLKFGRDMAVIFIIAVVLYAVCVALMGGDPEPFSNIDPPVYHTDPPVEVQP